MMMNWRRWGMVATCLMMVSCGADEEMSPASEAEISTPEIEIRPQRLAPQAMSTGWPDLEAPILPEQIGMTREGLMAFKTAIETAVNERGARGMTALLVRDGHVASFVTTGLSPEGEVAAGADTVWLAPRLAEPVIAVGMLMLYDEGQFTLDEPAAWHLPEGRVSEDNGPTIAQLMSGDGVNGPNLQLQAEIIQNVSDTPVGVYLEERIFQQLGLNSMTLMTLESGNYALETSLRDLARLTQILASGGGAGGARILDRETVGLMATDQLDDDKWALDSGLGEDLTPGVVGRGLGVAVTRSAGVLGPGASAKSAFSAGEGSFLLVDEGQGLVLVGLSEGTAGRDGDADIFRAASQAAYGALALD